MLIKGMKKMKIPKVLSRDNYLIKTNIHKKINIRSKLHLKYNNKLNNI